ncbi:hypothetical protein HYV11_00005, partial [Candidatus Dependentiae bacterium]|nr:hypothetical protein [Candidatus Dependentiae bacterium]
MRFIPKTTLLIALFIPTSILISINQNDYSNPIQASLVEKGHLNQAAVLWPIIAKTKQELPNQSPKQYYQVYLPQQQTYHNKSIDRTLTTIGSFNQPQLQISPSQLFAQEIVHVLQKQNVPTAQHYQILVTYFA